jgi:DNA-binding transcriptional LysR family regulator
MASRQLAAQICCLNDPEDCRWITWSADLAHLPDARWIAETVSPERIVLRTSHMGAQVTALRAGLGVALLPDIYRGYDGLTEVPLAPALARVVPPFPEGSLYIVGHRALRDVPRIAATWDFLVERMQLL